MSRLACFAVGCDSLLPGGIQGIAEFMLTGALVLAVPVEQVAVALNTTVYEARSNWTFAHAWLRDAMSECFFFDSPRPG
jgi:hypothetical protein